MSYLNRVVVACAVLSSVVNIYGNSCTRVPTPRLRTGTDPVRNITGPLGRMPCRTTSMIPCEETIKRSMNSTEITNSTLPCLE